MLSTPPAFILSQDQTLYKKICLSDFLYLAFTCSQSANISICFFGFCVLSLIIWFSMFKLFPPLFFSDLISLSYLFIIVKNFFYFFCINFIKKKKKKNKPGIINERKTFGHREIDTVVNCNNNLPVFSLQCYIKLMFFLDLIINIYKVQIK